MGAALSIRFASRGTIGQLGFRKKSLIWFWIGSHEDYDQLLAQL